MQIEKLGTIKKELQALNQAELSEICVRLARYKKENKELLSYLLYHADDPLAYSEEIKVQLEEQFLNLPRSPYSSAKSLRKIISLLGRHTRFTKSKQVETEFSLWFCKQFLEHADLRSSYKPLAMILVRQMQKLKLSIEGLEEDLQHDLGSEFMRLHQEALKTVRQYQNSF